MESIKEAALVEGVCFLGFELLSEVIDFLEGNSFPNHHDVGGLKEAVEGMYLGKDFSDILGQQEVVEKAVIAAKNQYNNSSNISARINLHNLYSQNKKGWLPGIFDHCGNPGEILPDRYSTAL